jgi:hypothetical protein
MNTRVQASTGCEQMEIGSDDSVRKKHEYFNGESVSNQIHIQEKSCNRKPWKSGANSSASSIKMGE